MNVPISHSSHPALGKFGYPIYHAQKRSELRSWLEAYAHEAPGLWLCSWRSSQRPRCSEADFVEEALCFGWIDSTGSALDDDRSLQLLTPRRPKSSWTRLNRRRCADLESAGLMTDAGRRAIEVAKRNGWWSIYDDVEDEVEPTELKRVLDAEPKARAAWDSFSATARKAMLWWVISAAREETRRQRIREIVQRAERGEKARG